MEQTLPKYGANQRSGGISGNTLKMIAIITMLIDHIGAGVVEPYLSMNMGAMDGNEMFNRLYYLDRSLRIIGRVAFPIFCFLLVEGFLHTRDVKKYGSRLLLFSLISEVPFDLIFFNTWFYPGYQNVYITLFIGLVVLAGYRRCEYDVVKKMLMAAIESISAFGAAALAFIPISMYNGTRGRMNLKYFFYWFYPVHLTVLYLIQLLVVR